MRSHTWLWMVALCAVSVAGCGPDRRSSGERNIGEPTLLPEGRDIASPAGGTRRAVIVGVSKYEDGKIPSLEFARTDAEAVYGFFIDENGCGYPRANVRLLVDEDATLDHVREAIMAVNHASAPEDTVLFYFAGHGAIDMGPGGEIRGNYLLPANARAVEKDGGRALDTASGLGIAQLQELLQVNKAKNLLIVLDACFSGDGGRSFTRTQLDQAQERQVKDTITRLKDAGIGRAVITATAPNQPALELRQLGAGLFTHYFLQSLGADTDRDGKVTLDESYGFLFKKVRDEAAKRGHTQTPTLNVNQIGVPVLRVLPRTHYGLGLAVHYAGGAQEIKARAEVASAPEPVANARRFSLTVDAWDSPVSLNVSVLRFTLDARGARSTRLLPDGDVLFAAPVTVAEGRNVRYPDPEDTGVTEADWGDRDADALFVMIASDRALDADLLDRLERAGLGSGRPASPAEFVRGAAAALEGAEELKDAALLYAWVREGRGAPRLNIDVNAPAPEATVERGPK